MKRNLNQWFKEHSDQTELLRYFRLKPCHLEKLAQTFQYTSSNNKHESLLCVWKLFDVSNIHKVTNGRIAQNRSGWRRVLHYQMMQISTYKISDICCKMSCLHIYKVSTAEYFYLQLSTTIGITWKECVLFFNTILITICGLGKFKY